MWDLSQKPSLHNVTRESEANSNSDARQAYLLYQTATIYSRTSMFPAQRRMAPITNVNNNIHNNDTQADTERCVLAIIAVASATLEAGNLAARHVVFPLFIAGCATIQADAKVKALELVAAFETSGIGKNTARTRGLLKVVYEEQRKAYDAGGSMGDVEWLAVARERGLTVVNCGL